MVAASLVVSALRTLEATCTLAEIDPVIHAGRVDPRPNVQTFFLVYGICNDAGICFAHFVFGTNYFLPHSTFTLMRDAHRWKVSNIFAKYFALA